MYANLAVESLKGQKQEDKIKSLIVLTFFTHNSVFYTFKSQTVGLKVNARSFFISWEKLSKKNASRSE